MQVKNPWVRFAARRARNLVVGIFILVVGSFMIVQLIPGDPARRTAGINAPADYVERLREQMGLNAPVPQQFLDYVRGVVTLDFGESFRTRQSVGTVLADRLPYTIQLAGLALALVVVISLVAGLGAAIITAGGKHPRLENAFLLVTGATAAIPEFLLGMFLVYIVAVRMEVLPVAGADGWSSILLPALAISLPGSAMLARVIRVQAIDVLRADYMRTAKSKRLSGRILYLRHALPNVLTATITIAGVMFVGLLGGSVVVENIFSWPGLGTAIVEAIKVRDYPLIQATILVLGVMVLVINTCVDVLLACLDPRSSIREA